MTGDCPCGGRLTESSHRISTESGAEKYGVASARMPIEVVTTICRSCGRGQTDIYANDGTHLQVIG